MEECEVVWEGSIKILRIRKDEDEIVRVQEEFDLDSLEFVLKKLKAEFGENMAEAIVKGMIGTLEELKLKLILLQNEIFD